MFHKFDVDHSLKKYTTLHIGGKADYFISVPDVPTMQEVLRFCYRQQLPYFILGKGSNLLIAEENFAGLVIANRIDFFHYLKPSSWHVGAGYSFSLLGSKTAKQGFAGLEFASGIPASVGGAVYMNAGANGHETCQTLLSVDFVTEEGILISLPKSELDFSYRNSSFQQMKGAIVGATFMLSAAGEARQNQLSIIQYRKNTQPYNAKSAGCIFRNPLPHSAGKLIEESGLKGMQIGGAQVSTTHANFIINTGNASAEDMRQLIALVRNRVQECTGVTLESEIRTLSFKLISEN
jgi:UDP-N-acetylmuramate dehydrogenase